MSLHAVYWLSITLSNQWLMHSLRIRNSERDRDWFEKSRREWAKFEPGKVISSTVHSTVEIHNQGVKYVKEKDEAVAQCKEMEH
jgi:hypothetical protein